MTRTATNDDAIVLVPVPRRFLPDIVKVLARLEESPRRSQRIPRDNHDRPWTKDDLKWLRQLLEDLPIALQLLDFTAGLQGGPVTFTELCEVTYEPRAKARGELARLTSIVRKYFDRDQWPAEAHWEKGGLCYRMHPSTASLWNEARDET
jgi:hypothetical protein